MIHLHNHEKQHRTKNTCEESKTGLGAFFSRNLGPDHMLFLESIIEIKCVQLQFTILYFD